MEFVISSATNTNQKNNSDRYKLRESNFEEFVKNVTSSNNDRNLGRTVVTIVKHTSSMCYIFLRIYLGLIS